MHRMLNNKMHLMFRRRDKWHTQIALLKTVMVPNTSSTFMQEVGKHEANRVHACLGGLLALTTW